MLNKPLHIVSVFILALCAVILIGLQIKFFGWILYAIGIFSLFFGSKQFRKDLLLVYISLGLLGLTPITTDISFIHILQMGTLLSLAIAIPYFFSRFIYKDYLVRFKFHHGRGWYKTEILYIFFTAAIAYILLPFALANTNSYLNWTVLPGFKNLFVLFLGTNFLGIWDELFFVSTVLGILRRHLSFRVANFIQAFLFTSFLYELGFRGWLFIIIFNFALIQGYVFKKTESLFYVITIHLTLDLILYLALIHAHHPTWMPIFLVK
jgi:membrane protease YdiL (CAAX protease family)